MLSMYVNPMQDDWDIFLPFVTFAYNSATQASSQFTPFFLMHGREPRVPIDNIINFKPSRYIIDTDDYGYEVKGFLSEAWKIAAENISKAQIAQKTQYNKHAHDLSLNPGDTVYKLNPVIRPGLTKKLAKPWEGPFQVQAIRYPVIQIKSRDKPSETIHVNRLKKTKSSTTVDPPQSDSIKNQQSTGRNGNGNPISVSTDKSSPERTKPHPYYLRSIVKHS